MFTYSQLRQNWAQNKNHLEEQIRAGEVSRRTAEAEPQRTRSFNGLFVRLGQALIGAGSALQPTAETKPVTHGQRLILER